MDKKDELIVFTTVEIDYVFFINKDENIYKSEALKR